MNNVPQTPPTGGKGGGGAVNPNPQNQLTEREIALQEYCKYIDNLADFGLFTNDMGSKIKQNLMNEGASQNQKIFDFASDEFKRPQGLMNEGASQSPQGLLNARHTGPDDAEIDNFATFLADNPDFFEDRGNLKKYLESLGMKPNKEELEQIAQLVRELENAAIERFSANSTHGEMLKEFNELAKNRLKTLSSSAAGGKTETSKAFTPEQISAMSSNEFRANESLINELLKSGKLNA